MGDGSPGSREAEGEGGEGFYIAQSGRSPDLLVILGGGGKGGTMPTVDRQGYDRPLNNSTDGSQFDYRR